MVSITYVTGLVEACRFRSASIHTLQINSMDWYTRPVLFVAETKESLAYYLETLGFKEDWSHIENDELLVAQISRDGFEIILNKDAQRAGMGRVFISLHDEQVDALHKDLLEKSVGHNKHWGMPVTEVLDLDGNELLFSPPVGDE